MPNVAKVIRDHVTLTIECVDRLYLNGYVPRLQGSGGVIIFLYHRGRTIASPALFGEITTAFKAKLQAFCQAHRIPWIEFQKGECKDDKDDVGQPSRERFPSDEGVVPVGVAQERAKAGRATKQVRGRLVDFTCSWTSVYVNRYYIYYISLLDWSGGRRASRSAATPRTPSRSASTATSGPSARPPAAAARTRR
jgi:hypothetical protein